jgi:hypothetical protein
MSDIEQPTVKETTQIQNFEGALNDLFEELENEYSTIAYNYALEHTLISICHADSIKSLEYLQDDIQKSEEKWHYVPNIGNWLKKLRSEDVTASVSNEEVLRIVSAKAAELEVKLVNRALSGVRQAVSYIKSLSQKSFDAVKQIELKPGSFEI